VTDFESKCRILGDAYRLHRHEENWAGFTAYNNIGFPLAYLIFMNVVTDWTPEGEMAVNQTFRILLESFGLEDTGFEELMEIVPEDY
jgi:hypothetical protein